MAKVPWTTIPDGSVNGSNVPVPITPALLRRYAIPAPASDADKKERGRALVVGGATQMVGPPALAATAVLRTGAGKVRIATCRSIAPFVSLSVPEARVFPLVETRTGGISPLASKMIVQLLPETEALLIGPGMIDHRAVEDLMRRLLPSITSTALVVDAAGLKSLVNLVEGLRALNGNVVLTPHASEMADMLEVDRLDVVAAPLEAAHCAAERFNAVIVMKGATTYVVSPNGEAYLNTAGNVGLATTGSGDALAGIIAGLCARRTEPMRAAVWGVYLHARAGEELAKRHGLLGYLAREIPHELPALIERLG